MSDYSNFLVSEAQLQLSEARKQKSEKIKDLGSPLQLSGKALGIEIRGNVAWIAENTAVARKLDLDSGKTLRLYKGHKGPVTCLAFCKSPQGSNDHKYLITGSWDKNINIWDIDTKELVSSTPSAHGDFVKSLLVIPSVQLLISSGSDKTVRFWDLSDPSRKVPLASTGSISAHSRPVECLVAVETSPTSVTLYTADTMGLIICWHLTRDVGENPRWRASSQKEYSYHRTGVNDMLYVSGQLWTASSDDTVQVLVEPASGKTHTINHPKAVRAILHLGTTEIAEPYLISGAGDILRVWDVADPEHPELIRELDAHWHDVTAIRFWKRTEKIDGALKVEPMILSTSLDGTIRQWKLTGKTISLTSFYHSDVLPAELLTPAAPISKTDGDVPKPPGEMAPKNRFELTEEEQWELDELMDSD